MREDSPEAGIELRDLLTDGAFQRRRKPRGTPDRESAALRRLTHLVTDKPESVLQELVNTAVASCGADSAGISLEEPEHGTFRWVVVAGSFAPYLNRRTPRGLSPCGRCLDSGRPQLYRVTKPYYDFLGVSAEPIVDGLLIPWKNDVFQGTLWAVSHVSEEAFSMEDYELLSSLADFASIILRGQHQQKLLLQGERDRGVADMAHRLAHRINNPLQRLTNTLYLARQGREDDELLASAEADLRKLSEQVAVLLRFPDSFKPSRVDEPPVSGTRGGPEMSQTR